VFNIRSFIAIEFDQYIKEYLWNQLQLIKEYTSKGNFTSQDNFHLTLNFLGEITPTQIEKVKDAITSVAINLQPFILKFHGLGQFSRGNKHILWVGINKSTELEATFSSLKNALDSYGFLLEKRGLTPHVTLGREVVLKVDFEQIFQKFAIEPKEIYIDKISLMESARIEGRLKYIPIYTKNF
jgi:RNA 2',3'-cyclic 3'-phosphodiesterase